MKTPLHTIPDNKQLLAAINSGNYLTMTIRSHQLLEIVSEIVISEALIRPHGVELRRLSFGLKIDLAVALGVIPIDSRPCYLSVNRIRNRFAHNPDAQFIYQDALDLYHALSPHQRYLLKQTPSDLPEPERMLGFVLAVLFMELKGAIGRLREQKLAAEVLHEMAEETLSTTIVSEKILAEVDDEIKLRLEKKKAGAS